MIREIEVEVGWEFRVVALFFRLNRFLLLGMWEYMVIFVVRVVVVRGLDGIGYYI